MVRPSLQRSDYEALAKKRELIFLDNTVPYDTRVPCNWKCIHCGSEKAISYRSLKAASVGCMCQSAKSFTEADYHKLGESLGIMWEPDIFPKNTKTPTFWRGTNGKLVMASYHDLGYGVIKKSLVQELGISHGTESGISI